jgi:peptidoglycan biosynthesis protein MviN/MurJ (putative lipid II flippase)
MWVLGFRAFPLSTTLAAVLNVGLLMAWLPRKVGTFEWGSLVRFLAVLSAASAVGGAAGWFVNRVIAGWIGTSFWTSAASLVLCGSLALVVFYGVARLLGATEVRDYLRRFLRR